MNAVQNFAARWLALAIFKSVNAWLMVRIAFLWWDIESTERYIADCERAGILNTKSLRYFRRYAAAKRVELALLMNRVTPCTR